MVKVEELVISRSQNKCELCGSPQGISMYDVPPKSVRSQNNCIMVCGKCHAQIEKREEPDSKHLQFLTASMWSEVPGIQIVSWRLLNRLRHEAWAFDSLDMLYLDDQTLEWAKATGDHLGDATADLHKDAFGNVLTTGDTVLITQSLNVKGASVNAKVGTQVKNIRLVPDNPGQIEGKIEGQLIVILTKYVRKQNV